MADNERHIALLHRHRVLLLALIARRRRRRRKEQQRRRWWVRNSLSRVGQPTVMDDVVIEGQSLMDLVGSDNEGAGDFYRSFRMTPKQFCFVLNLVGPHIKRLDTNMRKAISPAQRLAVTLRFLATGDTYHAIGVRYGIGKSTISTIVGKTCAVLYKVLQPMYLPAPTQRLWLEKADAFENLWDLPHCVAAVDVQKVAIQGCDSSVNDKDKGGHGLLLMAACDAEYKFCYVAAGPHGQENNREIFRCFQLGRDFDRDDYFPPPGCLPGGSSIVPYFFVGNATFALKPNFMHPFPGKNLDNDMRRIFNYRLSRATRCVENALGVLSARWRVYRRPFSMSLDNVYNVVQATVVLHNFLKSCGTALNELYCPPNFVDTEQANGEIRPGDWRVLLCKTEALQALPRNRNLKYTRNAARVRQMVAEYFLTRAGQIPWQYKK